MGGCVILAFEAFDIQSVAYGEDETKDYSKWILLMLLLGD